MGVFNFFIVLPQIGASLGLGKIMSTLLGNNTMNAVLLGGASMLLAALCVRLVDDNPSPQTTPPTPRHKKPTALIIAFLLT